MLGTSCNEKNCPGWVPVIAAGVLMIVMVLLGAINDAHAYDGEVVVTFNRELPDQSVEFSRTFDDKDDFEMWLANRLEGEGCDPYLTDMKIQFKPRNLEDI